LYNLYCSGFHDWALVDQSYEDLAIIRPNGGSSFPRLRLVSPKALRGSPERPFARWSMTVIDADHSLFRRLR